MTSAEDFRDWVAPRGGLYVAVDAKKVGNGRIKRFPPGSAKRRTK
jgi:hypothetical protein